MYVTGVAAPPPKPAAKPSGLLRTLRRLGKLIIVVVLIVLVLGLGLSLYLRFSGSSRLNNAIEALEREDPHWRWREMRVATVLPNEKFNSAPLLIQASALLPERWVPARSSRIDESDESSYSTSVALDSFVRDQWPLDQELDATLTRQLGTLLGRHSTAVARARLLANLSTGALPLGETAMLHRGRESALPAAARRVSLLLWFDAYDAIQHEDLATALGSIQACIHAGRAVGDEPSLTAQWGRLGAVNNAIRAIERVLAQSQPAVDDLRVLQEMLEAETRHPGMQIALRGERNYADELMEQLKSGELERFLGADVSRYDLVESGSWLGSIERWLKMGWYLENHARIHEELNRLNATLQRPLEEQHQAILAQEQEHIRNVNGEWGDWSRYRGLFMYTYLSTVFRTLGGQVRMQAELRCAITALAAERYRRQHGRWPESIEQLVPALLTSVPIDPFTSAPLRFRREPGGLAIYSVGSDGIDDNGQLIRSQGYSQRSDRGLRLWDVDKRRQRRTAQ
jgi:hypothetical protein